MALLVLCHSETVGWDAQVCHDALHAVQRGSDPYAANLALIHQFKDALASGATVRPPIIYVYSVLTLPLLKFAGRFTDPALAFLYAGAMIVGLGLQLWAGFQMARRAERRWVALLLPVIIFFPGLITDDVIRSGNIAYLLYGIVLAAAVPGWKRGTWFWYYLAVLFASIFKLPYLCMVAFPVLLDRRQWIPSCLTAGVGVGSFAAQFWVSPVMAREYSESIRFMFNVGHDFGYSFAGEVNQLLWKSGVRTLSSDLLIYVAFAAPFGLLLLYIAGRVHQGEFARETFVPIAFLGTAMLNPRIMNYDLVPITIPMLLLAARAIWTERSGLRRSALVIALAVFGIANLFTVAGPQWVPVELTMLCLTFTAGLWHLWESKAIKEDEPEIVAAEVETYVAE